MSKRLSWKMKFSIVMILLIIIIYGSNYLVLGDAEHIISYVWTHLGFIPVDILLVAFILDEIIEKKEKEAMLEKLDMLMSTFFSEVGNELINKLSTANKYKASTENLKSIKDWDENDFDNKKEEFTELINAILHLDEELEHRKNLALVTDADFGHLNGDMKRVYDKLVYEWVYYLKYLYKHYPYMIALVVRTNPFDADADVYVK